MVQQYSAICTDCERHDFFIFSPPEVENTFGGQKMKGMESLITVAEVVGGATLGAVIASRAKEGKIFGLNASLATGLGLAGAALLAAMSSGTRKYASDLMVVAAGTLAAPLSGKVLEALPANISGMPYQVGTLPSGQAVFALPPGQEHRAYQSVTGVAGLV
jgi:hypothetical protein